MCKEYTFFCTVVSIVTTMQGNISQTTEELEETNSFSNNNYFSYNTCLKCLCSFNEEEHYSIKNVKVFHI